jgi:hypothetical protein
MEMTMNGTAIHYKILSTVANGNRINLNEYEFILR